MDDFLQAIKVLKELGYTSFLPLQERAFQMRELYDARKNIFVVGGTSSGKTLIPLIHYVLERKKSDDYKMLFLVPYKALASQKKDEISEVLQRVFPELEIALSTGECREQDDEIRTGNVDVAVIIYEKAFHFSCQDEGFLQHYQTLVYDEFALSEDDSRGAACDLMLLRGQAAKIRLFILATPYYNWEDYIRASSFVQVSVTEKGHEVSREETPIFLDKLSGSRAAFHDIQRNPLDENHFGDGGTKDDLIENLCIWHLRQNHKILVFMNDCQEVRRMASEIGRRLRNTNSALLNMVSENAKNCLQKILDETGLLEEDLENLMSEEECLNFAQGIAYHNSWLGYELRALIEREILTREGSLKIVFCTETIAYGINSNVDVVIVADMHKTIKTRQMYVEKEKTGKIKAHGKNDIQNRFLTVNEYQNYVGRAGRYGWSSKGYAYAIMVQSPQKRSIRRQWRVLCSMRNKPPRAISTLLKLDPFCNPLNKEHVCTFYPDNCKHCSLQANEFAMPVLSLIPEQGIAYGELENALLGLPGFTENREWLKLNLQCSLQRLVNWLAEDFGKQKNIALIKAKNEKGTTKYYLTLAGKSIAGMMVTLYEASTLMRYLRGQSKYMPEGRDYSPAELLQLMERDPFDLFYELSYLPQLQKTAFEFFEISDITNQFGIEKQHTYQNLCTERLIKYHKNAISEELYGKLMYKKPYDDSYNYKQGLPTLYRTLLAILLYEWYRNASLSKVQEVLNVTVNKVTITPGRISRMSQQVSFYLQVAASLCQAFSNPAYDAIAQRLIHIEMCLYFGIRESNAQIIGTEQLRRLTRQKQLKVAQIMEFCSNHPELPPEGKWTRRQCNGWKKILVKVRELEENEEIQNILYQEYPILSQAENILREG